MSEEFDDRAALADKVARDDAWAWIVRDPRGRLIVMGLLQIADPLGASMVPGDPLGTAHREGQRSIGTAIYSAIMQAVPQEWARLHAAMTAPRENTDDAV